MLNQVVLAATLIAGLTFAVMIGTFYLAEQYLQRAAGYSALGASAVLILVALLVGAAAPIAGRLVDTRGERLPALRRVPLGRDRSGAARDPGDARCTARSRSLPLIPVGFGLGMLFVPPSRAALNSNPSSAHGRTSAALSIGRLLGAAVGAGLAGIALAGGPTTAKVHAALLAAAAMSLLLGIPASIVLGSRIDLAEGPEPADPGQSADGVAPDSALALPRSS